MWNGVRDRIRHQVEKPRRDKARWAEERRAWLAQEERTGQAVRRYVSTEAFASDRQAWAAAGWKVGSQSSRELAVRVGEGTLTRDVITVTYFREDIERI